LFTIDFYQKYKPNETEKHYVTVGRLATVVVVVLGILWIPVMQKIGKVLYEYLQDVQSLLAPGIAAVFLLGVISKRTTAKAGLWGLILGFVLGMWRLALKIVMGDDGSGFLYDVFVAPNWLHYEIALFVFVIVAMIVISFFTKKTDPAKLTGLVFGTASPEQKAITRASWNNWDVFHSIMIICIIVAFYVYFW
jgi:solute:Na+ symporter, SSS family